MSGEVSGRLREAREIFAELVELPGVERETQLGALSAGDPELVSLVRRLLAADEAAGDFLERDAGTFAADLVADLSSDRDTDEPNAVGRQIGPYRILSLLGRGGMGQVFLAERTDGEFEQRVALKLLKPGMDSEAIRRRFLRERQVLARLEHPNIARLLDGGTADGRPFFVLELVEGEPITVCCRKSALPVPERVRLMVTCCEAVEAAHRRLVVHRDIKPSNILVTPQGEVKLLDFGIAKVLDDTEETQVTRLDERVLTLSYAAPEQILGDAVTTATDVYSLGVVFYEILTGTLPHVRKDVATAELISRLEQETVERPSRVILRETPEALAAAGFDEGVRARLSSRLSGDLDSILLKALRHEPDRRYPSAAALGEDLQRHLSGLPVAARPDTVKYRAGKFVRRHRHAVAAAALVFLALVAGLAGTAWQARRAQKNAKAAAAEARRADRVKEFLIGLFEVADPEQSGGESVTARQLLDQGAKRLETELASEPEVQADLLETVARIDRSLGLLEPARSLAERALAIRERRLPSSDPAVGSGLATLGAVLISEGKLEEGEEKLRRALAILEKSKGAGGLAGARAKSDYAQALFWKGKTVEAERMEREVYETYRRELGEGHVQTAIHLRNLGVLLDELDRLDDAERAYRDSQTTLERRLGAGHANLAQSYLNLAVLIDRRSRPAEAEALYLRSLDIRRKMLGSEHPATGQTFQLLALFYLNQGRLAESEELYRAALSLFRRVNPKHFEVGKCLNGLALIQARRGNFRGAEDHLREVVPLFREALGEKHPFFWKATGNLAAQIAAQGRLAEAETIQREVLRRTEELTGPHGEETAEALGQLGETLSRRGGGSQAVSLHRREVEIQRQIGGEKHLAYALALQRLGAALSEAPEEAARSEARERLDEAVALYRDVKPVPWRLPGALLARGRLRAGAGETAGAREDFSESELIASRLLGSGSPDARKSRLELLRLSSSSSRREPSRSPPL